MGNFSNVDVYGEEYPTTLLKKIISKIIFVLQIAIMANMAGGDTVRQFFSFVPREWFDIMDRKKWVVGLFTFIAGNFLQSMLTASGAFEVFCDGQLVRLFKLFIF